MDSHGTAEHLWLSRGNQGILSIIWVWVQGSHVEELKLEKDELPIVHTMFERHATVEGSLRSAEIFFPVARPPTVNLEGLAGVPNRVPVIPGLRKPATVPGVRSSWAGLLLLVPGVTHAGWHDGARWRATPCFGEWWLGVVVVYSRSFQESFGCWNWNRKGVGKYTPTTL